MSVEKTRSRSRSALPFPEQMAQECGIGDQAACRRTSFRFDRRPRWARKESIRLRPPEGRVAAQTLSTSPAVSHGSGISRNTTSEKLSPGNFCFFNRSYAGWVSAIVVVAIYIEVTQGARLLQGAQLLKMTLTKAKGARPCDRAPASAYPRAPLLHVIVEEKLIWMRAQAQSVVLLALVRDPHVDESPA